MADTIYGLLSQDQQTIINDSNTDLAAQQNLPSSSVLQSFSSDKIKSLYEQMYSNPVGDYLYNQLDANCAAKAAVSGIPKPADATNNIDWLLSGIAETNSGNVSYSKLINDFENAGVGFPPSEGQVLEACNVTGTSINSLPGMSTVVSPEEQAANDVAPLGGGLFDENGKVVSFQQAVFDAYMEGINQMYGAEETQYAIAESQVNQMQAYNTVLSDLNSAEAKSEDSNYSTSNNVMDPTTNVGNYITTCDSSSPEMWAQINTSLASCGQQPLKLYDANGNTPPQGSVSDLATFYNNYGSTCGNMSNMSDKSNWNNMTYGDLQANVNAVKDGLTTLNSQNELTMNNVSSIAEELQSGVQMLNSMMSKMFQSQQSVINNE